KDLDLDVGPALEEVPALGAPERLDRFQGVQEVAGRRKGLGVLARALELAVEEGLERRGRRLVLLVRLPGPAGRGKLRDDFPPAGSTLLVLRGVAPLVFFRRLVELFRLSLFRRIPGLAPGDSARIFLRRPGVASFPRSGAGDL